MTDKRPSDRAIAQAFWEIRPSVVCDAVPFRRSVIERAAELDAIAAMESPLPSGWVAVPVEATEEMLNAIRKIGMPRFGLVSTSETWKAMIAAAPKLAGEGND